MSNAGQAVRPAPQRGPRPGRRALAILALAAVAIVVQGCGENGQSRPLVYDKGVYQGPVDEQLDQEQVDALRQRATRQQAQF